MGELAAGQVWEYKPRSSEEGSTLTICKVETVPKVGVVYHISISGLRVKNSRVAAGYNTELPHAPFSQEALAKSVTKLIGQASPPADFQGGYDEWRRAQGGVFTISVAEAVDFAEQAINQ